MASASALAEVAGQVEGLDLGTIRAVVEGVPLEWNTTLEELFGVGHLLYMRAEGVADRLRLAARQSRYP